MHMVTITNGLYAGKPINGTFPAVAPFAWYPEGDLSRDARSGKVKVIINGAPRGVWCNPEDAKFDDVAAEAPKVLSNEEILERIIERFDVLDLMGNGVIHNNIRSLIVSGAPGIGKTFGLEKKLKAAEETGMIDYAMVKGRISAIGLYIQLYENCEPGSVVVLDDVDVFSDEGTLNILKAALDTSETRIISWHTASSFLEEKEIPNSFEFQGSIVFITNTDIDREMESSSKTAPHLNALISRSIYLDLAVHTNRDIMIWVEHIVSTTTMLEDEGLKASQIADVIEWMKENIDHLRNVSLRTALHIASFVKTEPTKWQQIANVTMLKPTRSR